MDILKKFYDVAAYNEGPTAIILNYIGASELLITIDYIWNGELSVIYIYPWTLIPEEVKRGVVVCIRSPNISYIYDFLQVANLSVNFKFLLYGTEVNKWIYYLFFEILRAILVRSDKKFDSISLHCSSRCLMGKYTKVDIQKLSNLTRLGLTIEYNIEENINKIQYYISPGASYRNSIRVYYTHDTPNAGDFRTIFLLLDDGSVSEGSYIPRILDVYIMHKLCRMGLSLSENIRFLSGISMKMYWRIHDVHHYHVDNMHRLKMNWYIDNMFTI